MKDIYNKALTAIKYETDSLYSEDEAIEFIQNVAFDVVVLNKDIDYFNKIDVNYKNPKDILCKIYKEAFKDISPHDAICNIREILVQYN